MGELRHFGGGIISYEGHKGLEGLSGTWGFSLSIRKGYTVHELIKQI